MDALSQDCVFMLGDWRVEPSLNRLSRDDEEAKLEPLNMKLLAFLAARPGVVISHDEIERAVWTGLVVTPGSIYQSIAQLRRALGDDKAQPRYIETVARRGYRLVAPVRLNPQSFTDAASPQAVETVSPRSDEVNTDHALPSYPTQRSSRLRFALVLVTVLVVALGVAVPIYLDYEQLTKLSNAALSNFSSKAVEQSAVPIDGSDFLQPVSRTELLLATANREALLGDSKQARVHYEEALALQRQVSNGDALDIARILARLADLDLWDNEYAAAEAKAREAVGIFERTTPVLNPYGPRAHVTLAKVLIAVGRYDEAGTQARRSLELSNLVYGESHRMTIEVMGSLADLSLAEGRLDEAEGWARRALENRNRVYGKRDVTSVSLHNRLAAVLLKRAHYTEAKELVTDALGIVTRIDPEHAHAASAQHILGEALIGMGAFSEAERALLREIEILSRSYPIQWRIARAKSALGEALLGQGRIQEAEGNLVLASKDLAGLEGSREDDAQRETARRMKQLQGAKKAASSSRMARVQ
jgi:DNA-binding winged helix-turn-helix (wHTH) protein